MLRTARSIIAVAATAAALVPAVGTSTAAADPCLYPTQICVTGFDQRVAEVKAAADAAVGAATTAAAPVTTEVNRTVAVVNAEVAKAKTQVDTTVAGAKATVDRTIAADSFCTPPQAGSPVCVTGVFGTVKDPWQTVYYALDIINEIGCWDALRDRYEALGGYCGYPY